MARKSRNATIAVDLSSLPPEIRDAVGTDLSRAVLSRLGPIRGPVVVGKLGPWIYGMIRPDLLGKDAQKALQSVLKLTDL